MKLGEVGDSRLVQVTYICGEDFQTTQLRTLLPSLLFLLTNHVNLILCVVSTELCWSFPNNNEYILFSNLDYNEYKKFKNNK